LPSLPARIFEAFRNAANRREPTIVDPGTTPCDGAKHERPSTLLAGIAARGLFIIGAARTGTTILQNALNDSSDIFLFGEPRFHRDPGSVDFAERYNGMHRTWGNQENKSSHCPVLFEEDAPWWRYLERLADLYGHVGSKIVINPTDAMDECRQLFDFQCRHFYLSHHVFTFRNPLDVLMSTRGLAQLNGGRVASHAEVLRGFFAVVQLFILSLRNLPHVHAVFHEAIDADVFHALEKSLDTSLSHAMDYYDRGKVRHYTLQDIPQHHRPPMTEAIALYEDFRREALAGFGLLQIEQNDDHLDPVHFTALGRLSWRVTRFLDALVDRDD